MCPLLDIIVQKVHGERYSHSSIRCQSNVKDRHTRYSQRTNLFNAHVMLSDGIFRHPVSQHHWKNCRFEDIDIHLDVICDYALDHSSIRIPRIYGVCACVRAHTIYSMLPLNMVYNIYTYNNMSNHTPLSCQSLIALRGLNEKIVDRDFK